jgi:uncharacterized phage-associated protein
MTYLSLGYSASDIAAFLISETIKKDETISNKKLQKLLYYSQGWYLALANMMLFDDEIEAWAHGPVVRKVYNAYKDYGFSDIREISGSHKQIETDVRTYLNSVLKYYGPLGADELERMTHAGEPWRNARGNKMPHERADKKIALTDMRTYFSNLKRHAKA